MHHLQTFAPVQHGGQYEYAQHKEQEESGRCEMKFEGSHDGVVWGADSQTERIVRDQICTQRHRQRICVCLVTHHDGIAFQSLVV